MHPLALLVCIGLVRAQFPPPVTDQTIHAVPGTNITIRYKEPGICETTPGVKSVNTHFRRRYITIVCRLR